MDKIPTFELFKMKEGNYYLGYNFSVPSNDYYTRWVLSREELLELFDVVREELMRKGENEDEK